ncbi:hypothetical protein COEREDRAFT_6866 [Coemansia reversa NRRL 1564]|uniref:Outer kinetochore protein DAD2 n=1 Tax=Coemansia reversa (strain ATCC 12441 / NRRL 1564) TaxID=763665 RepID=A0A2G5BGI8_COERN|nr:hypothetical protein COEREDRAFT_6866 [Coemansia reversa NRRL 1564]|eukprot:PIA18129.1 hypothetical protein COEREDRAFT_6866 [Coemansia reversa NRRL 1564]
MSTQAIADRLEQKKQELAALHKLDRQIAKIVQQYEAILRIASGWSNAFENAALVDIPQTNSTEDDTEQPESVIRIPVEDA